MRLRGETAASEKLFLQTKPTNQVNAGETMSFELIGFAWFSIDRKRLVYGQLSAKT